jgi:hypothetical protein
MPNARRPRRLLLWLLLALASPRAAALADAAPPDLAAPAAPLAEDALRAAAAALEVGDLPTTLYTLGLRPSPLPGPYAPPPADDFLRAADALAARGDFFAARAVLAEGERYHLDDQRFGAAIARAIHDDPRFAPAPQHLKPDVDLDAIKHLGGGSTISLRLLLNREVIGAVKPHQTRANSYFRAEIAAWRLCALLRCGFFIPRNAPIVLTQKDFELLYSRPQDDAQRRYAEENFADLRFQQDPTLGSVLLGTWKTWLPSFTRLPIESVHIWQPWLSLNPALSLASLEVPAITQITANDTRESSKEYDDLSKHMAGATAAQIARQVSDVLAFDFLVTNWDRFSTNPRYRGGNCHFAFGRLVSLDNGAAFWDFPHSVPSDKVSAVERFSPQLIRALRDLEREPTLLALFPDPTDNERLRFAQFWHRRAQLLDRVDALVLRYGHDAVLSLP